MIMKTNIWFCAVAIIGAVTAAGQEQPGLAKLAVTAHVVDENAAPISGATVRLVFGERTNANAVVRVEGVTDKDGRFTGEGYSDGSLGATVAKEGYYASGLSIPPLHDIVDRRQQSVEGKSILRPIGKPVALFVKGGWFDIPAIGQPCGYDLEKGDWVSPYGTGAVPDLVIALQRNYKNPYDFEVKAEIRFSNPLDGIMEVETPPIGRVSFFEWPREAPEAGYQPVLMTRFACSPGAGYEKSASDSQKYFFRVRTVVSDGRIVSALYGKISGAMQLAPFDSSTSKIRLNYYLNPTPLDRNLEWDTRRNLFAGPSDPETPNRP